ncbi:hypothetical protein E3O47_06875 [Cryobacterium sp. TMT2-17-1]|uniref:hypothetical protein n=1 Tax=Cryobacterium sp. TMT2-17-1 TaxID=1259248 RepID=UPI00106929D7|nr:hypothetical protein [Cryobacterium sp. TMT2-17-1]TFC51456.1 hypothetical protein E3O47_06875 [Cryobacterium sp. TMT2-17-1]
MDESGLPVRTGHDPHSQPVHGSPDGPAGETVTAAKLERASAPDTVFRLVAQKKIPADKLTTHRFRMDQILEAYDTFSRAAETKALKVVISRKCAPPGRRLGTLVS